MRITDKELDYIDCDKMTIWLGVPCCVITQKDVTYEVCRKCKWNRTEKKDA